MQRGVTAAAAGSLLTGCLFLAGEAPAGAGACMECPAATEPAAPMGACPSGWTRSPRTLGCEPWPSGERPACADGERLALDGTCLPTPSDDCPADGWPGEASPDAIFVDPAAPPGGSGSRAAPYASLAEALAATSATSRAHVVLRVGVHHGCAHIGDGLRLDGACGGTIVDGDGCDVLLSSTGEASIRSLTLRNAGQAIRGLESAAIEVSEVRFETDVALHLEDRARATVRASLFERSSSVAQSASQATVFESTFRSAKLAFAAMGDAQLTLDRCVIFAEAEERASPRYGVYARDGAAVTGSQLVVEDTAGPALWVEAGSATITGAVMRRAHGVPEAETPTVGVAAGSLVLNEVVVEESVLGAIHVSGGELEATELVVAPGTIPTEARHGAGVQVHAGSARLTRSVVHGTAGPALEVRGDGTLAVEHVSVHDTAGDAIRVTGRLPTLQARHLLVERAGGQGIALLAGHSTLIDARTRDTAGIGIRVGSTSGVAARADLWVVEVESATGIGVDARQGVFSGTCVTVTDVRRGTASTTTGLALGGGTNQVVSLDVSGPVDCGCSAGPSRGNRIVCGTVRGAPVGLCIELDPGLCRTYLRGEPDWLLSGLTSEQTESAWECRLTEP